MNFGLCSPIEGLMRGLVGSSLLEQRHRINGIIPTRMNRITLQKSDNVK